MDFLAAHAGDFELQATVVEQQDVAIDDILGQVLVIEADAVLVAHGAGGVEDEGGADDQRDLVALELADANLRTLQVAKDADRPAVLGGGGTDAVGACLVVIGRAVREIHPDDINAGLDHAFENFRGR